MEVLALLVFVGIGVMLALGALVILPLMLIGLLLRGLFFVALLPFRILGGLFAAGFTVFAVLGKLMLMLVFLVGGLLFLVFGVVLLPLIPILMIAGAIWLALRLFRPATA